MPRIIRKCKDCSQKFIAVDFVLDLVCLNCKKTTIEQGRKEDDCNEENDNDIHEDDVGVNSEAEDDFHCTQIVDILSSDEDEDDEEEDEPLTNLIRPQTSHKSIHNPYSQSSKTKIASKFPEPINSKNSNDNNSATTEEVVSLSFQPQIQNPKKQQTSHQQLTTCFVCGANLMESIKSGWKGRIDHIKRCSRKHGVQAKDIIEPLDEEFTGVDRIAPKGDWHSNNSSTTYQPKSETTVPKTTVQSLLKSNKPICTEPKNQNALNMLMAGARRAAQEAKQPKETKQVHSKQSIPQKNTRKRQWFNGPKYSNRNCPSYKKIPGTDFVVDGFQYAASSLTTKYFLTHYHSDHYGGITRHWDTGIIYCSEPTANLVNQQLGVDRQYLHPLPIGVPVPILSGNGKTVLVTLHNANHCPGAIMFHFEVDRRSIMHVGDFRWHRQQMALLGERYRIDDLFLDTTYCNPKYVLPTQAEAIQAVVETAVRETHKYEKLRLLLVFGAYTIGKERIYLSVAKHLNKRVYVDRRRFRVLQAVLDNDDLQWITTNPSESMLWVVPLGHVNMKKLHMYLSVKVGGKECQFDKVVGFRPTGWSLAKGTIITTVARSNLTVHSVPYSEHSSFPELVDCIACWRPKRIIPTVSVSKTQQQIDLLLSHLSKS